MGVIASSMRLMTLTNMKNYLDYKLQINAEKMAVLLARVTENEELYSSMNPDSPEMGGYRERKAELNAQEKRIEAEEKMLNKRLQAVMQEMQACEQMLDANIQSGVFSYGRGGGR